MRFSLELRPTNSSRRAEGGDTHRDEEEEEETRRETWKLLGRNWSKLRRDFVKWCTANHGRKGEGEVERGGLQIQTYPLISQLSKLQRQRALIDSQVESHALSPIKFDVSAIYKCLLHSTAPLASPSPADSVWFKVFKWQKRSLHFHSITHSLVSFIH